AEIQRELRVHLPVVLEVEAVVSLPQIADSGRGDGSGSGYAQQEVGNSGPCAGPALWVLRECAVEIVIAARAAWRESVADDEPYIRASFEGVAAMDDGNAIGELGDLRQLDIRESTAFSDSGVTVHGYGGQPADYR